MALLDIDYEVEAAEEVRGELTAGARGHVDCMEIVKYRAVASAQPHPSLPSRQSPPGG